MVQVTNVNLKAGRFRLLLRRRRVHHHLLLATPLPSHAVLLGRGRHAGYAATVTGPVELEEAILTSGDTLTVQLDEHILRRLSVGKFDKAITKRRALHLVADELDVGDRSNLVELLRDVVLLHPRLDVTDPERARLRCIITAAALAMLASFASPFPVLSVTILLHWRVATIVHLLAMIATTAHAAAVRLILLIAVVHVAMAAVVSVTGTDVLVMLLLGLAHHRLAAHRWAGLLLLHGVSVRVVHL